MGKIINIPAEFSVGDTVYLKTDPEQDPRMVVGILVKPNKTVLYELAYCEETSFHYEIEISIHKNITK